jgi:hypothetical protein
MPSFSHSGKTRLLIPFWNGGRCNSVDNWNRGYGRPVFESNYDIAGGVFIVTVKLVSSITLDKLWVAAKAFIHVSSTNIVPQVPLWALLKLDLEVSVMSRAPAKAQTPSQSPCHWPLVDPLWPMKVGWLSRVRGFLLQVWLRAWGPLIPSCHNQCGRLVHVARLVRSMSHSWRTRLWTSILPRLMKVFHGIIVLSLRVMFLWQIIRTPEVTSSSTAPAVLQTHQT